MQVDNRLLDDFARLMNGALGALAGAKGEFETLLRQQVERFLADMDLVPREEFEAVRAMAQKAREEQDRLETRIAVLEKALAKTGAGAATAKRTAKSKAGKAGKGAKGRAGAA